MALASLSKEKRKVTWTLFLESTIIINNKFIIIIKNFIIMNDSLLPIQMLKNGVTVVGYEAGASLI